LRKVLRTLAILAAATRAAAILVEVILAEGIPVGVTPGAAIQEGAATQAVAIREAGLGDLAMAGRISRTIQKFSRCFVPQGC